MLWQSTKPIIYIIYKLAGFSCSPLLNSPVLCQMVPQPSSSSFSCSSFHPFLVFRLHQPGGDHQTVSRTNTFGEQLPPYCNTIFQHSLILCGILWRELCTSTCSNILSFHIFRPFSSRLYNMQELQTTAKMGWVSRLSESYEYYWSMFLMYVMLIIAPL